MYVPILLAYFYYQSSFAFLFTIYTPFSGPQLQIHCFWYVCTYKWVYLYRGSSGDFFTAIRGKFSLFCANGYCCPIMQYSLWNPGQFGPLRETLQILCLWALMSNKYMPMDIHGPLSHSSCQSFILQLLAISLYMPIIFICYVCLYKFIYLLNFCLESSLSLLCLLHRYK